MRNLLAQALRRWNLRFLDRWPLAVVFGLTYIIPACLALVLVGGAAGIAGGINQSYASAYSLAPSSLQNRYLGSLHVIQDECFQSRSTRSLCFDQDTSTSDEAVSELRSVIAEAGLNDCKVQSMPAEDAYSYEYFVCQAGIELGTARVLVWAVLWILAFVNVLVLVASVGMHRTLLPRFGPELWITPYAVSALVLAVAPAWGSLVIFALRRNATDPSELDGLLSAASWYLVVSFLVGAWLAVDLRTFPPDSVYVKGLGILSGYLLGALVAFALGASATSGGNGKWLIGILDLFIVSAMFYLYRRLRRSPSAGAVRAATSLFLRRFLGFSWPVWVAGGILFANGFGGGVRLFGLGHTQLAILLLGVHLLVSIQSERRIYR